MQVDPCSWSLYRYDKGGVKGMLIITAIWWRDEGGGKGMLMIRAIWWRRRGMRGEILAHCGSQDLIRVDTLIGKQSIIIFTIFKPHLWNKILKVSYRHHFIVHKILVIWKRISLNFKIDIWLMFHKERGIRGMWDSLGANVANIFKTRLFSKIQAKTVSSSVKTCKA